MILAIFNAVVRIIAIVTGIDSLVHIIQGDVTNSAQETTKFLIQTNTNTTVNDLSDPTFGLAKIVSNQALIIAAIAAARSDILTAIANLVNGTTPVVPISPAPPTYTAPTSSANAVDVWNFLITQGALNLVPAQTALGYAASVAKNINERGIFEFNAGPMFYALAEPAEDNFAASVFNPPTPLIQNVRRSDTVLSFLTREAPSFTWVQDGTFNGRVHANVLGESLFWICVYYDGELQEAAFGAGSTTVTAPVWPGLSSVTLGASLALSDGLTIPGPLDGVIVHVTAVTYPVSFYPFGAVKSFVKIGGIIFVDDNGQAEMAQPLGLEQDVICPQTMVRADHAIIRLKTGTTGTIQPWIHS